MDTKEVVYEIGKAFLDSAIAKGDLLPLLFERLKEVECKQDEEALMEAIQSVSRMISEDCGVYLRHSK